MESRFTLSGEAMLFWLRKVGHQAATAGGVGCTGRACLMLGRGHLILEFKHICLILIWWAYHDNGHWVSLSGRDHR